MQNLNPSAQNRKRQTLLDTLEEEKDAQSGSQSARAQEAALHQPTNQFLSINFNQDASCIALGTADGFRVYTADPLQCKFERRGLKNIQIVELLFSSQIIAFVGGQGNKRHMDTRVVIWDDFEVRKIEEIKVTQPVIAVRLRRDKIVVVMINSVNMYNFPDADFLGTIKTVNNPSGIVAVSTDIETFVLAAPSEHSANTAIIQMLNKKRVSKEIMCHRNPIQQLCLTNDGRLLATCSQEGTRIKVFNTYTAQELRVYRYGLRQTIICHLAFSGKMNYLAAAGLSNTVHCWKLGLSPSESVQANSPEEANQEDQQVQAATSGSTSAAAMQSSFSGGRAVTENQRVDQGFFRNLMSKIGRAELSHSRWTFQNLNNENKKCAFTADESSLMLITEAGNYWRLQVAGGEHTVTTQPQSLLSQQDPNRTSTHSHGMYD